MPPQLVLIRHAQALHNVDNKCSQTPRTMIHADHELGVEQCKTLRQNLKDRFSNVQFGPGDVAIVASPMRRTLQTAQLSLDWLPIDTDVKIVANADWQENSAKPCDTGSSVADIQPDFPNVDFTHVDPVWPDKTSPAGHLYAYTRKAILARAQRALDDLSRRPEKVIFVVAHSGFLRLGVAGYWWFNSDYRIFDFVDGDQGTHAKIKQREETLSGGLGLSWTEPVEIGFELPDEDPLNEQS